MAVALIKFYMLSIVPVFNMCRKLVMSILRRSRYLAYVGLILHRLLLLPGFALLALGKQYANLHLIFTRDIVINTLVNCVDFVSSLCR